MQSSDFTDSTLFSQLLKQVLVRIPTSQDVLQGLHPLHTRSEETEIEDFCGVAIIRK